MKKIGIKVGSVTLAVKGRELLMNNGFRAYITRNPHPEKDEGCGYIIFVINYNINCLNILNDNGIKVYGTTEG